MNIAAAANPPFASQCRRRRCSAAGCVSAQAELALVTAAVRARLVPLLDAVRADLGPQRAAAAERDAQTEVVKDYILVRVPHPLDILTCPS